MIILPRQCSVCAFICGNSNLIAFLDQWRWPQGQFWASHFQSRGLALTRDVSLHNSWSAEAYWVIISPPLINSFSGMSEINNRDGSASCFPRHPGLSLPVISQIEFENSANGNLWIIVLILGWKTIGREVLFVPWNEAGWLFCRWFGANPV